MLRRNSRYASAYACAVSFAALGEGDSEVKTSVSVPSIGETDRVPGVTSSEARRGWARCTRWEELATCSSVAMFKAVKVSEDCDGVKFDLSTSTSAEEVYTGVCENE